MERGWLRVSFSEGPATAHPPVPKVGVAQKGPFSRDNWHGTTPRGGLLWAGTASQKEIKTKVLPGSPLYLCSSCQWSPLSPPHHPPSPTGVRHTAATPRPPLSHTAVRAGHAPAWTVHNGTRPNPAGGSSHAIHWRMKHRPPPPASAVQETRWWCCCSARQDACLSTRLQFSGTMFFVYRSVGFLCQVVPPCTPVGICRPRLAQRTLLGQR